MKFKCPECQTRYKIDDAKIPEKGAKIRCKKCQKQFKVKKHSPQTVKPKPAEIKPKPKPKPEKAVSKKVLSQETEKLSQKLTQKSTVSSLKSKSVHKTEKTSKEKTDVVENKSRQHLDDTQDEPSSKEHLPATTQMTTNHLEKISTCAIIQSKFNDD